jgi:hypothetical protein
MPTYQLGMDPTTHSKPPRDNLQSSWPDLLPQGACVSSFQLQQQKPEQQEPQVRDFVRTVVWAFSSSVSYYYCFSKSKMGPAPRVWGHVHAASESDRLIIAVGLCRHLKALLFHAETIISSSCSVFSLAKCGFRCHGTRQRCV